MADLYILKNGRVVNGMNLHNPTFFTTGHLAQFTTPTGKKYTSVSLLDTSLSSYAYVEENSFYENIKNENYAGMVLYNEWTNPEVGDVRIEKREIDDITLNYCWYPYYKPFDNNDSFSHEEINVGANS